MKPLPPNPELDELLARSREMVAAMTPEQRFEMREAQRRSWVVGEMMLSHPEMTREEAVAGYERVMGRMPAAVADIARPAPTPAMRLVIVESPYKGEDWSQTEANVTYARAALRDCLLRGESPIASHLLLTQEGVLDDKNPDERAQGIAAGHAWMSAADAVVVYVDRGVSKGMIGGINLAMAIGRRVEYRILPESERGVA